MDRRLIQCSYSYTLCLSEKALHKAMKQANVPAGEWPQTWVHAGGAATHVLRHRNLAFVTVSEGDDKRTIEQVYGMLAHEAVHIFQEHCRDIGEHVPSDEFQAYSIQLIAQRLMESYRDQTKK